MKMQEKFVMFWRDRTRTIDRALLLSIAALAWPTVIEQALLTSVQYVNMAMVGRIGANASAAIGLTQTTMWLIYSPMWAMSIGVLSCIAKARGAGDDETVRSAAQQSIWFVIFTGAGVGLLSVAAGPFLPRWLGCGDEIYRDAALYFMIISAPLFFRAAMIIFGAALRAVGNTRTPLAVNVAVSILNILLNEALIGRTISVFGLSMRGAGLGVLGAGLSTAISQAVGGVLMWIALCRDPRLSPLGRPLRWNKSVLRACVAVGLPVAGERTAVSLGQVVFTSLVSQLGTLAIATHSIALTAEMAFYIPGFGMQTAASTMAGYAAGAGDEKQLRRVSKAITGIAVALMSAMSLLLFLFPGDVMSLFAKDARVIEQGAVLLRMVACSEPLFAVSIIMEGVFNGVGDTKAPFLYAVNCMWGVRIAGTVLCLDVAGFGLASVWACMIADNVARCILLSGRFARGSWKKHLLIKTE